jgi:hypothetical protein
MSRPAEIRRYMAGYAVAYGPSTGPHGLLAQAACGAPALAQRVGRWGNTLPTPADLAEARRCAEGMVRVLGQLATYVDGGPPDAA